MKKYIIIAAVIASMASAAYILSQPSEQPLGDSEENGLVIRGDVEWVVGNTTYRLGNISTYRIIIGDTYLIVGDTIYGAFTLAMTVNTSWNLVSWPTLEIIPKNNITVIYGDTVYTWQEACDNIIIAPWVYTYNGSLYVETDYFYPYMGYWLYSHHDGVILCLM